MTRVYSKRLGLFRDPAVEAEIASLDAVRDCQRIAHLLAAYEFPWDLTRSLELALFYTYGSDRVSRLLDHTAEFRDHGQKRYDDTAMLVNHMVFSGWDGEFGRQAIARVNRSHGHYRIPNEDFLFVLWTFIEFPIRWTRAYGHRPMTGHEQLAWFSFWRGLGERMGMTDLPSTKGEFDRFVERYKAEHFVPSEASARVAAATVSILEAWVPAPMRSPIAPVVYSFFDDDPAFLAAVGAKAPPPALRPAIEAVLRGIGRARRQLAIGDYPSHADSNLNRTYGKEPYAIGELRPTKLAAKESGRSRDLRN